MQSTKKEYHKKRKQGHWEGKYFCDCRTKNYRRWRGLKRYGKCANE